MRVRLVLPLLLMMSFAVAPAVLAQVQPSEDVIALDNWKMHFGDDPQWATPGFDDSGWASSAGPSREPGRSKYQGYRWYRTTINIPDNFLGRDLGLGLGLVEEVYEVYVEGVSVGRFGHWEPQPESPFDRNMCFRVPAGLISGNKVHIAIRRWNGGSNTGYFNFYTSGASRFDHPIEIGLYSTVQSRTELYSATGIVRNLPSNLSLLASLLAGCIAFALYSAQRNRIEYLLLGISCALAALGPFAGSIVAANEHVMRRSMGPVLILLLYAVMQPVSTLFLAQVCPRFRRWLQLGAAIEFLTVNSSAYALATGNSAADAFFWTFVFYPPLILTVLASVGLFQQKNRGSLAIALAVLLRQVAEAWTSLAPHWFHLNDLRFMPLGPFLFDIRNIAQVAMITVILIVLYLRYREEQARALGLEQDMASARRMQEQLLGGSELKVPGFDIHAVYRPSKEVGGDFYRTVPLKDGSLLVVVGDVSGRAWMRRCWWRQFWARLPTRPSAVPARCWLISTRLYSGAQEADSSLPAAPAPTPMAACALPTPATSHPISTAAKSNWKMDFRWASPRNPLTRKRRSGWPEESLFSPTAWSKRAMPRESCLASIAWPH